MRQMAARTTFGHRRMLPDEGTSLVCMTIGTQLERRVGTQKWVGRRSMRLMTIIAVQLPFEQRHMRALAKLDSLTRMAGEAGFSDGWLAQ